MSRVTLSRPAALAVLRCSGILLAGFLAAGLLAPVRLAAQGAEDLRITVGKSLVIDYPVDVARISTSNPDIVDAVAVSTREILLHAKSMGVSTVVVWSREGQRTFYNVNVDQNLEPSRRLIRETFPNEDIQVLGTRDSLTLIGRVSNKEISDRVGALAASLAKTVVNNLRLAPPPVEKQVILRVKFAELDRNLSHQIGVNIFSTGAANTPGAIGTGQFGGSTLQKVTGTIPGSLPGFGTEMNIKDVLNIFAFRPDLNLGVAIKALQTEGVLQILAEPNLVTTVGKEASFLVGGEFPIPVLQGGSGAAAVTIQFREFGIRLTFNPQLTENGTLKMYVKPEVSTIDLANAVTLNGFTIPALATRRMETNVELAQGQSFVIGGLIDDRVNEQLSKIPGLSSIPILGTLFKSRSENKSKSELIVMVTPELVDPLNPGDPKPEINMPNDWLPALPPHVQKKSSVTTKDATKNAALADPRQDPQVITAHLAQPDPTPVPLPNPATELAVALPEPAPAVAAPEMKVRLKADSLRDDGLANAQPGLPVASATDRTTNQAPADPTPDVEVPVAEAVQPKASPADETLAAAR